MNTEQWSGTLLIIAFAALAVSTIVNAPGLYATVEIEERLRIITAHRRRWLANQWLVAVYCVITVAGFATLADVLATPGPGWVAVLGAVAIAAGAASGMYFVYRQTADPRGGYSGAYPVSEITAYVLWLLGAGLIGIAILQSDLPAWLGYVTVGATIAYSAVFVLTRAGYVTPFLLALLGFITGIVLLVR